MSAVKVVQSILPFSSWNISSNNKRIDSDDVFGGITKRRKTHQIQRERTWQCALDRCDSMEDSSSVITISTITVPNSTCAYTSEEFNAGRDWKPPRYALAPHELVARSLAEHGLPDRLDPMSIDQLIYFENDTARGSDDSNKGGGVVRQISAETVLAMELGDTAQILNHMSTFSESNYVQSLRTVTNGETLLHLACRYGRHEIIEPLMFRFHLNSAVLDRDRRTPLRSVCLAMSEFLVNSASSDFSCNLLDTMRLLLRHNPMLVLFTDSQGKTPLDYLDDMSSAFRREEVNAVLVQEQNVIERVVQKLSDQRQQAISGTQMTAIEKIDFMVNLEGIDAAILETGFSV